MRKPQLYLAAPEAASVFARAPVVHVVGMPADRADGPLLRTVHGVVWGDQLIWHGSVAGAKSAFVGQPVTVNAERVLAEVPSYWVDAERACPATTYYESAQVTATCRLIEQSEDKASALEALMQRFQSEGGHQPITAEDPLYQKAVRGIRIYSVPLASAHGRRNVGQSKTPAQRVRIMEALWKRGAARDLETIEFMRATHPEDPTPEFLQGPYRMHVVGGPEPAKQAAELLVGAYWNQSSSFDELRDAHAGSPAWVWAEKDGVLVGTARAVGDGAKHAWIYDVIVQEKLRGEGLGHRLMTLLLDHPAVRGVRRLHLGTRDAHFLYEPLGFKVKAVTAFDHMECERVA